VISEVTYPESLNITECERKSKAALFFRVDTKKRFLTQELLSTFLDSPPSYKETNKTPKTVVVNAGEDAA
jgi:hypothetical protein